MICSMFRDSCVWLAGEDHFYLEHVFLPPGIASWRAAWRLWGFGQNPSKWLVVSHNSRRYQLGTLQCDMASGIVQQWPCQIITSSSAEKDHPPKCDGCRSFFSVVPLSFFWPFSRISVLLEGHP